MFNLYNFQKVPCLKGGLANAENFRTTLPVKEPSHQTPGHVLAVVDTIWTCVWQKALGPVPHILPRAPKCCQPIDELNFNLSNRFAHCRAPCNCESIMREHTHTVGPQRCQSIEHKLAQTTFPLGPHRHSCVIKRSTQWHL